MCSERVQSRYSDVGRVLWRVFLLNLAVALAKIGFGYASGAVSILQLHAQALGFGIAPQLMSSLPYLATILVLVAISRARGRGAGPGSLGTPFVPDH